MWKFCEKMVRKFRKKILKLKKWKFFAKIHDKRQNFKNTRHIFSDISHRFRIFSLIYFSKNAKVFEIRTKIFAFFPETFCSLETLAQTWHPVSGLGQITGWNFLLLYFRVNIAQILDLISPCFRFIKIYYLSYLIVIRVYYPPHYKTC